MAERNADTSIYGLDEETFPRNVSTGCPDVSLGDQAYIRALSSAQNMNPTSPGYYRIAFAMYCPISRMDAVSMSWTVDSFW